MNRATFFFLFRFTVTLGLVIILTLSVGVEEIINTFSSISLIHCIAVSFCILFSIFLGALNSWLLLRTMRSISFFIFFKTYIHSWTISLITPGQSGDVSLVFFLKNHNIPFHCTGIAYFIDKVITITVFFFIGWYGSYFLIPELKEIWFPIFMGIIFSFIAGFILMKFFHKSIQFLFKRFGSLGILSHNFRRLKAKWSFIIFNILLTFLKWLVISISYFTAFHCFNIHVKMPEIGVIPILATIVGYIPISIGGIGTVEITATHLFSKIGVEEPIVLSVYILLRSLQYIIAIVMLSFFYKNRIG